VAIADFFAQLETKLLTPSVRFEGAEDVSPELRRVIEVTSENHRSFSLADALNEYRNEVDANQKKMIANIFTPPSL
jgi:F0F1-type ATP synthase delta subunit